jgi:hypothetical protein
MALPEKLATDLTVGDPLPSSLNEERTAINAIIDEVVKRIALPTGAATGDLLRFDGVKWATTDTRLFEGDTRPEGNFAAPVGSRYIDKTAQQGAAEWVKVSGGDSNVGWMCLAGDTGVRDITALIDKRTNGVVNAAKLSRVGQLVELYIDMKMPTSQASPYTILTLPAGFRPRYGMYGGLQDNNELAAATTYVGSGGGVNLYSPVAGKTDRWIGHWFTGDPWPNALPGAAG